MSEKETRAVQEIPVSGITPGLKLPHNPARYYLKVKCQGPGPVRYGGGNFRLAEGFTFGPADTPLEYYGRAARAAFWACCLTADGTSVLSIEEVLVS